MPIEWRDLVRRLREGDSEAAADLVRLNTEAADRVGELSGPPYGAEGLGVIRYVIEEAEDPVQAFAYIVPACLPARYTSVDPARWLPFRFIWVPPRYQGVKLSLATEARIESEAYPSPSIVFVSERRGDLDLPPDSKETPFPQFQFIFATKTRIEVIDSIAQRRKPTVFTTDSEFQSLVKQGGYKVNDLRPLLDDLEAVPPVIRGMILAVLIHQSIAGQYRAQGIEEPWLQALEGLNWAQGGALRRAPNWRYDDESSLFNAITLSFLRGKIPPPPSPENRPSQSGGESQNLPSQIEAEFLMGLLLEESLGGFSDLYLRFASRNLKQAIKQFNERHSAGDFADESWRKTATSDLQRIQELTTREVARIPFDFEVVFVTKLEMQGLSARDTGLLAERLRRWIMPVTNVECNPQETLAPLLRVRKQFDALAAVAFQEGDSSPVSADRSRAIIARSLRKFSIDVGSRMPRDLLRQDPVHSIHRKVTIISDVPLELGDIGGHPISSQFPSSRIPTTPATALSAYLENTRSFSKGFIDPARPPLILVALGPEEPLFGWAQWFVQNPDSEPFRNRVHFVSGRNEFLRLLEDAKPSLLAFVGHAGILHGDGILHFPDDSTISTNEVGGQFIPPPLVILMGCETASCQALTGNFASHCLRAGSLAALGTLFPIPGSAAFYYLGRLLLMIYGRDESVRGADLATMVLKCRAHSMFMEQIRPLVDSGFIDVDEWVQIMSEYARLTMVSRTFRSLVTKHRRNLLKALPDDRLRSRWEALDRRHVIVPFELFFSLLGYAHLVFGLPPGSGTDSHT